MTTRYEPKIAVDNGGHAYIAYVEREDGKCVLYEDHLREMALLRAEVERFKKGMPDKPHILTMINNIEIGCIEHGESKFTMCDECIEFNNWLRRIASANNKGEVK